MITKRFAEFDYIRVISLIGILLCHSSFELGGDWIGRYLGSTFNTVFLILSAFIFGIRWSSNGKQPYRLTFVTKRVGRLSKSYYPYLAILFLFLYLSQDYFSWRKLISHFLYLPWFDKISGFGHLWYLTMIVICYIAIWIFTIIHCRYLQNSSKTLVLLSIWGGISLIFSYIMFKHGIPGSIASYTLLYLIIFYYSNQIISFINKMGFKKMGIFLISTNLLGIIAFYFGVYEASRFWANILGIACGLTVTLFLLEGCKNIPSSKIILWLSGICFEVYLVHEFFLGHYSVYKLVDNPVLGLLLLIGFSVILAFLLHLIATRVLTKTQS